MIPNKSKCFGTIWTVSKQIWNVSNIQNILKCFGSLIGNFSYKFFFRRLLKGFQKNINVSQQFELFPNIFWNVSNIRHILKCVGTFIVQFPCNQFFRTWFQTNLNISKHYEMFQDFEKSEQMFSNIRKIVTTYIVQSEMFRNKIYRVNNFSEHFWIDSKQI